MAGSLSVAEAGGLARLLHRPAVHLTLGLMILVLDAVTGPFLMFPILFVLPVTFSAWYCSRRMGLGLAILLPCGRALIAGFLEQPNPLAFVVVNAVIRIAVLGFIAHLVSRTAAQTRAVKRKLRVLEGLLPICMCCKRIRDDRQRWQPLEVYITEHSEAAFTHGLCPDCARDRYGLEPPKQ